MGNLNAPKREEIIGESLKLFVRKGFNHTAVREITEATGLSKAAFYWHFPSKDELLMTILNRYESSFVDGVIRALKMAEGDFLRKFKYMHKWSAEFAYNNRDLCVGFITMAAEIAGSGTPTEARIKDIQNRHRGFLKRLLMLGRKEGKIRDDLDLNLVVHVIAVIYESMLIEWYSHRESMDGSKFAKTYREIALSGILKKGMPSRA
jgi:AcrR family transcriptional regulator